MYKSPPPLAEFLMKPLNVVKTGITYHNSAGHVNNNFAFYTTDGIRYEVPYPGKGVDLPLYESKDVRLTDGCSAQHVSVGLCSDTTYSTVCGSYGLAQNPKNTTAPPCVVIVDVNGDKKPNPVRIYRGDAATDSSYTHTGYIVPKPEDNTYMDVFTVMITDRAAIPYGAVAQRALYSTRDNDPDWEKAMQSTKK